MPDLPKRGRPPKMLQPTDRLAELSQREKALAIKANARHRYTFDLPIELYEHLLDQAESWGQPLPDVVRACLRKGLEHIKQFGGGALDNPFVYGGLRPPTQSDIDPSGQAWPPAPPSPIHIARAWDDIPHDPRFDGPKLKPGMLPSGATIDLGTHAPTSAPFIPQDDPGQDG